MTKSARKLPARVPSDLEAGFLTLWRMQGRLSFLAACGHWEVLLLPETEYCFDSVRQWRFDFAWPEQRVAVELEGGVWTRGRHQRPRGFLADCEKYNAAAAAGWLVLRYTAVDLQERPIQVVEQVAAALRTRMEQAP